AIAQGPDGEMLITDPVVGYRSIRQARVPNALREFGRGNRLLAGTRGDLWVGTSGEGLWRIRHGPGHAGAIFEKATTLTGLVANGVMSLLEDRDGNIWVGTRGLNRLTPQKVTPLTDIGLVNGVVSTPDGGIWVLNADEVIRIRAASGTAQREHISFHGLYLGAIHRDRAGALWVATNSGLRR